MRETTSAKRNRGSPVETPWLVVRVGILPQYRLEVEFVDGTVGVVELESFLFQDDPGVFEPLRDPARFAEAFVDETWGCVTWPGGLDLAPDAMYDDIRGTSRRVAGRRD